MNKFPISFLRFKKNKAGDNIFFFFVSSFDFIQFRIKVVQIESEANVLF